MVTAGPDGNLWFTNTGSGANSIGRVTPAGAISDFTDPTIVYPRGITAGPDGNLWFTLGYSSDASIGRITPAGVVSNFTDPTINAPVSIAAGPDGNLWFTNLLGDSIGSITPAGVVSNFTDFAVNNPWGIAAGPDGNLWFTNAGNRSIGWITPAGVESNFTGSGTNSPRGIAAGPDGMMWFVNEGNNSIAQVTVSAGPSAPGAPTSVFGVAGNAQVAVSWAAPASDGGAPITGYTVTASPDGATCSWTTGPLTCTVPGLANGTPYTFTVAATNVRGTGPPSAPSSSVTPAAGDLFHPLGAPTRILDSRPPPEQVGPYATPWTAGLTREVSVAGVGGVPADATAVTLNVTVTGTTSASFLTLWPKGAVQPTASNLNWSAGQTIPNAVTVMVGTGNPISVFNNFGTVHVIADAAGWYG
jgi:hypothetical protein